ncbi:hypothetical protein YC2023_034753 [Brassica napus]
MQVFIRRLYNESSHPSSLTESLVLLSPIHYERIIISLNKSISEVCSMKMSSDDVTPNRSSTEEESDSSVSKKLKVEDEDDRNMEDESDTDSRQALSVETEEDMMKES